MIINSYQTSLVQLEHPPLVQSILAVWLHSAHFTGEKDIDDLVRERTEFSSETANEVTNYIRL